MGYRIEADGASFVFATDTEPSSPFHDRTVRDLAKGADVLVYDAQYTPEQLATDKKGWGHSSWLEGTRIAKEMGVNQLVLFHHDPDNDDNYLDGLVEKARQEFPCVAGAAEGMEFELPGGFVEHAKFTEGFERRRDRRYHIQMPLRLAIRSINGKTSHAKGFSQDISRTGIYFVTPAEVEPENSVELEVVVPKELTHTDDMAFRFVAKPIRVDRLNGSSPYREPVKGVAARREPGLKILRLPQHPSFPKTFSSPSDKLTTFSGW